MRKAIETEFADPSNDRPLLITAGAGGVGLNLTAASVVIQCEIWWKANTELQTLCRVYRQGQQQVVDAIRLDGMNSSIDALNQKSATLKPKVNNEVMEVIIRKHDEQPEVRPLLHGYDYPIFAHQSRDYFSPA